MPYQHFSVEEREAIQAMWWKRESVRSMALSLHRSPSSVFRELMRNFPAERRIYTPRLAHERALAKRRCRGRTDHLKNDAIRSYVIAHLKRRWSPEQIAGRINIEFGERISHEAIYQFIYDQIQPGNGLAKKGCLDLRPYLRRRRKGRLPKGMRRNERVSVPHGPSIDTRPTVVAERTRIGDWEGDTVASVDHRVGVNTLVERKTGFVYITKLTERNSAATVNAMTRRLSGLPPRLRHTVTLDNGAENSGWRTIERRIGIHCFFAHPYHAWERGTNENTNGLLRDYFPKKTNFTIIREDELAYVEREINTRPRKRLGWKTPQEVMSVALQG